MRSDVDAALLLPLRQRRLIVVSGHRAGGMAVWLHLDWIAERYGKGRVRLYIHIRI